MTLSDTPTHTPTDTHRQTPRRTHSRAEARAFSNSNSISSSVLLATSTEDAAAAMKQLSERGVNNPTEFASLGAQTIRDTLRWFDAPEQQRRGVGVGVLVAELRRGGRRPPRGSLVAEQQAYGESVCSWLDAQFPELSSARGPHPAAVAAVYRLHWIHGKGRLTRSEHGESIRAAVRAWDARWGEETTCS